jgi:hypothetical protein
MTRFAALIADGRVAKRSSGKVSLPHDLAPKQQSYTLEQVLVLLAVHDPDAAALLPRYQSMKQYLEKEYYPWIQASCPYFTDHGAGHVNSVIQAASGLLAKHLTPETLGLNAIEIFLLLAAILWHDVGNALGRARHADRIPDMTEEIKKLGFPDPALHRIVGEIAKAHAGSDGLTKARAEADCVVARTVTVYPRALAAVVRFADEVSENRSRISLALLPSVPTDNQIYWQFANCITAARPDPSRERVVLTIEVPASAATATFPCPKDILHRADAAHRITLIEYLISRLEKMNNERAYCEPEFRRYASIREIVVRLAIIDTQLAPTHSLEFVLAGNGLAQSSYPTIDVFNRFFQEYPNWRPDAIAASKT